MNIDTVTSPSRSESERILETGKYTDIYFFVERPA